VVVVGVDLAVPYTDYMVALAEVDIPHEEVHYRRVDMVLEGHFAAAQGTVPELHWAWDRREGWQTEGPSLRN